MLCYIEFVFVVSNVENVQVIMFAWYYNINCLFNVLCCSSTLLIKLVCLPTYIVKSHIRVIAVLANNASHPANVPSSSCSHFSNK